MAVGSLEFLVGSWTGVLRSLLAVGLRLLQLLVGGGSLKGRSQYAAAYFIKADEESLQRASASKMEIRTLCSQFTNEITAAMCHWSHPHSR